MAVLSLSLAFTFWILSCVGNLKIAQIPRNFVFMYSLCYLSSPLQDSCTVVRCNSEEPAAEWSWCCGPAAEEKVYWAGVSEWWLVRGCGCWEGGVWLRWQLLVRECVCVWRCRGRRVLIEIPLLVEMYMTLHPALYLHNFSRVFAIHLY